jgi:hypothetical protein
MSEKCVICGCELHRFRFVVSFLRSFRRTEEDPFIGAGNQVRGPFCAECSNAVNQVISEFISDTARSLSRISIPTRKGEEVTRT